jgi:uncharacterized protein (TIGR02246 family)
MNGEHTVGDVLEKLVDAWNRRDWLSFSRLFAEDADYVTGAGLRLAGRNRIRDDLSSRSEIPSAHGQVTLVTESLRILQRDVAVILCRWQMGTDSGQTDGLRIRAGLLMIVIENSDEGWRIVALHNTDQTD